MARILVIDDEVHARNALQLILEYRGHHVVVAESRRGVAAIEAYAFDAVIVDIFRPGMDGFETISILRESAPKTVIIAISGYAFREVAGSAPDFLKMACSLGATYCLRKPINAWEIITAVEGSTETVRPGAEAAYGPQLLAADCAGSRCRA